MPPTTPSVVRRYYPTLSSVVSLDDFPESLGFLKQAIQQLFDKIHYKDLQYKKSPKGDAAFYSLTVVSRKLAIELFGSGISLVLNPDDDDTHISAFPVTVEYRWKILAYLRSFDLNSFSFTPQEIFETALIILNISEEQALAQFINTFTVPIGNVLPLEQFITDLKQYNSDPDIQSLNLTISDNTRLTEVAQAIHQHTDRYATLYAFGAYLLKNDLTQTKEKLGIFFRKFIPQDIEAYIKDILRPIAKATLTVSAGIEFPRKILFPYKLNGAIWEREPDTSTVLTRFHFGKVLLYADTQEGVGYNLELVGDLRPKYSEIGNTGLLIQIEKLKLDLSDKVNIPEADADGRPVNFRGVYADAVSVTLPAKWFKTGSNTNGSTLRIGGYNLLIGTGGVSGTFALEAIPTKNASTGQITDFFTNKFDFVYPITGLVNNAATHAEEEVEIADEAALLTYLNALDDNNHYAFKFPLSITPVGGTQKEFNSQQEFRNYITDIIVAENGTMWFNIGSEPKGFLIGFKKFDITFKQSKVTTSNILGALEIKKFVYPDGTPNAGQVVHIDVEGHLHDNGDFNLTAAFVPPYPIVLKDIFTYTLKTVELGKEDDDFYIGTSGSIQFEGFLKEAMGLGPIEIDRLRIYSNGSIDLIGGSVNLIKPLILNLGPVEITVTAINFGSHQKEVNGHVRKFNFFGLNGGISVDPLGIEVRGDGVNFYYCVDEIDGEPKPKPYVHVKTLYLDLTIPSSSPVAIINGWLSIPEPGSSKEYAGGLKLQLPDMKIAGRVDMKLMPKYPAFIINAEIALPAPIALGTVAIYGFEGLLGYRYVAEKEAAGLVTGVDSWYDYYKSPPRGIHVRKFNGPDKTKLSGKPFSIGAGASLGTSFDNGTVINIKAMVLLSIPSLFMIDGRAAILSARLGLEDQTDPPFFAFVAIGDNTLEFGFGADFKMPTKTGAILSLYADVQAGFFFKHQRPWYVNIGTDTNPVTSRILTLITLKSYLMLAAKGIQAGARSEFDFKREYGIIKVHAWAYIEIGGKISFERPQYGAYLKAGVGADIDIKFLSFYLAVDIMFGVEASKPFLIYGKFHYSVEIKILWVFKFSYDGDLEVVWEYNSEVDRTPINPLINETNGSTQSLPESPVSKLVKGVNMLSNETFELAYLGDRIPTGITDPEDAVILNNIIPLDTYIDIKTEKGLLPGGITDKIGGYNNPAEKYTDLIPPDAVVQGRQIRQVKHQYAIDRIDVKFWNGSQWKDYNPYKALYPDDANDPAYNQILNSLKIGQFQKTDGQYNTVRLLATTPFSFTEQGQPGWYVPEQYGITSASLFCEGQKKEAKCTSFLTNLLYEKYYCSNPNHQLFSNGVAFLLMDTNQTGYAHISNEVNSFLFARSLSFDNSNKMQILLPGPSVQIGLKISNFKSGVKIKYYAAVINDNTDLSLNIVYGNPDPHAVNQNEPFEIIKSASQLHQKIEYDHTDWRAVTKIIVEPIYDATIPQLVSNIKEQIATIKNNNTLIALGILSGKTLSTANLEKQLHDLVCGESVPVITSFVNRYTKPDSLNYYFAKEFIEKNNISYIYSIGTSKGNGIISKVGKNGDIVWERSYTIDLNGEDLVFKRIIQLNRPPLSLEMSFAGPSKSNIQYIIYATTSGNKQYILSINTSGGVLWMRQIMWNDNDVIFNMHESKTSSGFYISISDRNEIDKNRAPFVGYFDSRGNLVNSLLLDIPQEEFIINSIYTDGNNVILAGRYIAQDSRGIVIKLDNNLNIIDSFFISDQYITIHDIKTIGDKYLISGYSNGAKSVFVGIINSNQAFNLLYLFPDTKNHGSVLQLGKDGFYLLLTTESKGILNKLDLNLNLIWAKEVNLPKGGNGIRNFTFNSQTQKLSFNIYNQHVDSLLAYTNKDMNTCFSITLTNPDLEITECRIEPKFVRRREVDVAFEEISVYAENIFSEKIELCPATNDCGDSVEEICMVYNQILGLYGALIEIEHTLNRSIYIKYVNQIITLLKSLPHLLEDPTFKSYYKGLIKLTQKKKIILDNKTSDFPVLQVNDLIKETSEQVAIIDLSLIKGILGFLNQQGSCTCDCVSKDFTLIHEICWMTIEDYQYNINIPDQSAISLDTQATIDGINKFIQPIWMPDTNYYIHFVLKDIVDDAVTNLYPFTYGFTTGGPIGFYHQNEKSTYGDIPLLNGQNLVTEDGMPYIASAGQVLEDVNGLVRDAAGNVIPGVKITPHPDQYVLTSLRPYIDYVRSYPNANGNLLNAKPLFYSDQTTQIFLFFNKAYVTHFFNNWEAYEGKASVAGRLKVVIKDPVEDISITNPPALDYDPSITTIPQTEEAWISDEKPQVPFVISQYSSLFNSLSPNCVGSAQIIKPASKYIQITPKNLKPNKLYTVIVNNMFDINHNGILENSLDETREVHNFVFKTSIYPNFRAQVRSFYLEKDIEQEVVQREAIFVIEKHFSSDEISAAYNTIKGLPISGFSSIVINNLESNYQHSYDRIFEGIFGFKPLEAAISTEVNIVRDLTTDKIVAIIVINPEPFNNPQMPLEHAQDTIQVMDGNVADTNFEVLHSRDFSRAIIMHQALEINATQLRLRFQYKIWNGENYMVPAEANALLPDDQKLYTINLDINLTL